MSIFLNRGLFTWLFFTLKILIEFPFISSAGIYLFGCLFYWIYASGEVQPWAKQEPIEKDDKTNKSSIEKNGKSYAYANEGIELKDEWFTYFVVYV